MSSRALRRNGKPQACEPCRRSKLRCDHAQPCSRCRARNTIEKCVFHPAPLTRPRPPKDGTFRSPSELLSGPNDGMQQLVAAASTNSDLPGTTEPKPPSPSGPGFLGSTSYSAVFDADQEVESLEKVQFPGDRLKVDAERISVGARVLALLPDVRHLDILISRYYSLTLGVLVPEIIVRRALSSIKQMPHDHLATEKQRYELSTQLFTNTSKPLPLDKSTTAANYHTLFTGPNLRWEILGVIFTLAALTAVSLSEWDYAAVDAAANGTDRKHFIQDMAKASDVIIDFCAKCESLNDLFFWLLYQNMVMLSMHDGDSGYSVWRRLGDISTVVFALGLHQDGTLQADTPPFLLEVRRRCFAKAYLTDKSVAAFLGRPPRIPIHYCVYQLPLDLSDEDVLLDGEALAYAKQRLDVNGWNTHGVLQRSTMIRVRLLTSVVREEILQLSLGSAIPDMESRILAALTKLEGVWEGIPTFIHYNNNCWTSGRVSYECYMLLLLHLDSSYNRLLLHRLFLKHTGRSDMLHGTARELLSTILVLVTQRDRLISYSMDYGWLFIFYGLPSAGLLAVELLRHQQQGEPSSTISTIPRAETIRNLSTFVSALEWAARPGGANYDLCCASRRILVRILDAVLDPHASDVDVAAPSLPEDPLLWMGDLFGDAFSNADSFLNQVEAIDWDLGPWPLTI